jgi:hypothetical protein
MLSFGFIVKNETIFNAMRKFPNYVLYNPKFVLCSEVYNVL